MGTSLHINKIKHVICPLQRPKTFLLKNNKKLKRYFIYCFKIVSKKLADL